MQITKILDYAGDMVMAIFLENKGYRDYSSINAGFLRSGL